MVDKYLVRDYIANKIGTDYLIPLLGVYENANHINTDELPDELSSNVPMIQAVLFYVIRNEI